MAKNEIPELTCPDFHRGSRRVKAVCLSREKGRKAEVGEAELLVEFGALGDFHAGTKRQVSLLAEESVNSMREKGLRLKPGDFGENIVTEGIDLKALGIGTKVSVGRGIELEITEIGKVCPERCAIYYQAGDCIMPREGVFGKVLRGGLIKVGDEIRQI